MNKFTQAVKNFWNDEEGLTAVEYAVAGGVVTAALVAGFGYLSDGAYDLLYSLVKAVDSSTAMSATPQ